MLGVGEVRSLGFDVGADSISRECCDAPPWERRDDQSSTATLMAMSEAGVGHRARRRRRLVGDADERFAGRGRGRAGGDESLALLTTDGGGEADGPPGD